MKSDTLRLQANMNDRFARLAELVRRNLGIEMGMDANAIRRSLVVFLDAIEMERERTFGVLLDGTFHPFVPCETPHVFSGGDRLQVEINGLLKTKFEALRETRRFRSDADIIRIAVVFAHDLLTHADALVERAPDDKTMRCRLMF